jgi:hypothetical protein
MDNRKSINPRVFMETLKFLRPRKVFDLNEIKNVYMYYIVKLMKTQFKSSDQAIESLKQFFIDFLLEQIKDFKTDDDYLHRIQNIIETLKSSTEAFVADYREHYYHYRDFNKWVDPFELQNITIEVLYDMIESAIKRYESIVSNIQQNTGIMPKRNQYLESDIWNTNVWK